LLRLLQVLLPIFLLRCWLLYTDEVWLELVLLH
jgi:hypothetical protein